MTSFHSPSVLRRTTQSCLFPALSGCPPSQAWYVPRVEPSAQEKSPSTRKSCSPIQAGRPVVPIRPNTRSCSACDSILARLPPWAMQVCRAASQLAGPSNKLKHLEPETVQPEGQVAEATHWKGLAVPQETGAQE